MAANSYKPPGRLGDRNTTLATDPRANPAMVKALSVFGLDQSAINNSPWPADATALTPLMKASHDGMTAGVYNAIGMDLPTDHQEPEVTLTTKTIKGVDNNDITLYIHRLASATGPLPCVVYLHGGGMVIIPTINPVHDRWMKSLAIQGVVSIAVDYRNAWTEEKHNPFPTGLNDCAAAVKWIGANKESLGISHLIVQGESGGGNLSIVTTLKAKRDGWLSSIAGVYATVPYISAGYGWSEERKLAELPSLVENDGYLLSTNSMAAMAYYYGPNDLTNPHAWPYHSSVEDLKGLPPFILAMDELDPLRDEGMAFHRKLLAAGVVSAAQVNLGGVHASSLILRQSMPEVHESAVRSVTGFAKSLGGDGGRSASKI